METGICVDAQRMRENLRAMADYFQAAASVAECHPSSSEISGYHQSTGEAAGSGSETPGKNKGKE